MVFFKGPFALALYILLFVDCFVVFVSLATAHVSSLSSTHPHILASASKKGSGQQIFTKTCL
jgi:hypothetical protein